MSDADKAHEKHGTRPVRVRHAYCDSYGTPISGDDGTSYAVPMTKEQARTTLFEILDHYPGIEIPLDKRVRSLLDKATEELVARLLKERVEAEMKLRELYARGFKCSCCGTETQVVMT